MLVLADVAAALLHRGRRVAHRAARKVDRTALGCQDAQEIWMVVVFPAPFRPRNPDLSALYRQADMRQDGPAPVGDECLEWSERLQACVAPERTWLGEQRSPGSGRGHEGLHPTFADRYGLRWSGRLEVICLVGWVSVAAGGRVSEYDILDRTATVGVSLPG